MGPVLGPPTFAAEVLDSNSDDLTGSADARKHRDYFAAGTLVIWDVDLEGEDVVRVFKNGDAETPAAVYRRGDRAEAEPAVPGWTMPVDDLFATPGYGAACSRCRCRAAAEEETQHVDGNPRADADEQTDGDEQAEHE